MLTWLALVVLVPAILVPVVLLVGFAGCELVFPLDDTPPNGAREESFEATLTGEVGRAGRTIVQRIEPARLFRSGSKVVLTLQRPSGGDLILQSLFISQVADGGDPYDSAADLTALLPGALLLSQDAANGPMELEPVAYQLDHTKPLLVAFDVGTAGRVRFESNVDPLQATAFVGPSANPDVFEAGIGDRQPGYVTDARIYLVQRIEVVV